MDTDVDVVVIGAGQAGLGTAAVLAEAGIDTVVLERGRIGETWRSQRWNSFALNTPNWMNGLPGHPYSGDDPDGFMTHTELVGHFERYAQDNRLTVHTGTEVTSVSRGDGGGHFRVETRGTDGDRAIDASSVVVASGALRTPRVPPAAADLPPDIAQFTTATYRDPSSVPAGAALVVGGGQSGAQIVEDLLEAGRTVHFSISNAARVPRRYRGRDFMEWWRLNGSWELRTADADPAMLSMTNPLVSGVGPLGHSISFQHLAARGVGLMGRLERVEDGVVYTDDRVPEYVAYADAFSRRFKEGLDEFIATSGESAPAAVEDERDAPSDDPEMVPFVSRLDLRAAGVTSVTWATGFVAEFPFLRLDGLPPAGIPPHADGVAEVPGLYFVGFPWLSKRKSGIVFGIDEDATRVAHAARRHVRGEV